MTSGVSNVVAGTVGTVGVVGLASVMGTADVAELPPCVGIKSFSSVAGRGIVHDSW